MERPVVQPWSYSRYLTHVREHRGSKQEGPAVAQTVGTELSANLLVSQHIGWSRDTASGVPGTVSQ